MTATVAETVGVDVADDDSRHARCCKPAVPRGLCRQGGPLTYVPVIRPASCADCAKIWAEHQLTCPRDSGFWPPEGE